MRNDAREAALNIIFAEQFNTDCLDALKAKIYRQFKLEKEEDLLFAKDLVATVEERRAELIQGIEDACHHYKENRINPTDKSILLIALAEIRYFGVRGDGLSKKIFYRKERGFRKRRAFGNYQ